MERIRIAIDPQLEITHGPEIHWAWRLLLAGIGWTWEEVEPDGDCEIAYVPDPASAPRASLCIRANPQAWARQAAPRLEKVMHDNEPAFLAFEGEAPVRHPIQYGNEIVLCHRDLIFDLFWLVSGQEECFWPRDKHGFFDLTGTLTLREQVPRQALVSQMSTWLQKTLVDLGCAPPLPRWPSNKTAAAGVGHDVDYPEAVRWLEPFRILARQGSRGIKPALDLLAGRRDHWAFPMWVEMEKQLQIRSAFYFVARRGSLLEYATSTPDPFYDISSPRFQGLFDFLAQEGFEVGLHASYLAYQSQEKLAAEKRALEEACGQRVLGNRHHYWHLDPDQVEDTLLIHEHVDLMYDSSLIHERYLGWRRALAQPYFPFHQAKRRELRTLQIPIAWMDDQVFGHQADNPGPRHENLQALADQAAKQEGCLLIDVHNYVFDDALFPGWADSYRRLWQYLLDRGDFWLATPAEIAKHWIGRHEALVQASLGLKEGAA